MNKEVGYCNELIMITNCNGTMNIIKWCHTLCTCKDCGLEIKENRQRREGRGMEGVSVRKEGRRERENKQSL